MRLFPKIICMMHLHLINLESTLIAMDTSTFTIDTHSTAAAPILLSNESDTIWLHPICNPGISFCSMSIGNGSTTNYSLSDAELDTINTISNTAKLYLGDIDGESNDISSIFVSDLSLSTNISNNVFISALNNQMNNFGNILFEENSSSIFNQMNIKFMANNKIDFGADSSIFMVGDESRLLIVGTIDGTGMGR